MIGRFLPRAALPALLLALAGCSASGGEWHGTDVTGSVPDLALTLTRADTGAEFTAAEVKGQVTALYFGYTHCPDICPMTLSNLGRAIRALGPQADAVRVLFVTVDPDRDTPQLVADYADAFGPEVIGLRGGEDRLAQLAKRYRVAYSVTPADNPDDTVVTHSSAVYLFDRDGNARLLENSLSTAEPDIDGVTADLRRLVAGI